MSEQPARCYEFGEFRLDAGRRLLLRGGQPVPLTAKVFDTLLVLVESGGDNLTATFSPDLVDVQIYVVDVAGGDKVPRKGGPGVTQSELLIINKIDLAKAVGASLEVMEREARQVRDGRPVLLTNLRHGEGLSAVLDWVREQVASRV